MELKGDILVDKCYELNKENIFISPLSLFFALSMIANGTDRKTKEEIESFLGEKVEYLNDCFKEYLEDLPPTIELASSIWTNGINLKEDFKNILEKYYDSEANTFTSKDINVINKWVKDNTNGKIKSIIDKIDDNDLLLLLNAIYFKDGWIVPFKKNNTRKVSFNNLNGNETEVAMMYGKENLYYENDKAFAFTKGYESRISFVGILPKKEGDFNLKDLDIENLLKERKYGEAIIGLPKLKFDSSINFNDVLKSLGINEAFSQNANFSNLSNYNPLSINKVLQKTSLTIDEEGSIAAGVTSIGMMKGCIRHEEPIYIILNRPFVFMIYDKCYEYPLFIGKIVNL